MSAETQTMKDQGDVSRCWCCGQPRSEDTWPALQWLNRHLPW